MFFGALKDLALAGAAVTTAWVAVRGLQKWREELRGKTDFEVARALARATYKVRDELAACRAPLIRTSEFPPDYKVPAPGQPTDSVAEANALAYVYTKRWEPVTAALREFDAQRLEAEALWGADIRQAAEALHKCATTVFVAIESVLDNTRAGGEHFQADKEFGRRTRSQAHAIADGDRQSALAVLLQFHGGNNGSLALTFSQAKGLGVTQQWKLYAGLRLLCDSDLLICTRRGRLAAGDRLPSLYGVTWKGIDEPKHAIFDGGINVSPIPSHSWAKWQIPDEWNDHVKRTQRKSKGRPASSDSLRGVTVATYVGSGSDEFRSPRGVSETHASAPHVVVASKISAGSHQTTSSVLGSDDRAIAGLIRTHSHLLDDDIARTCCTDVVRVAEIRARLVDGWQP